MSWPELGQGKSSSQRNTELPLVPTEHVPELGRIDVNTRIGQ